MAVVLVDVAPDGELRLDPQQTDDWREDQTLLYDCSHSYLRSGWNSTTGISGARSEAPRFA